LRLLFIADGRSPIALNWIRYFLDRGDQVHLISTFDCEPDPRYASYAFVPAAFSELKAKPNPAQPSPKRSSYRPALQLRTLARQWLGPLTLQASARRLTPLIERIEPDLVHAMRIPYEGMLAALALQSNQTPAIPLLTSVWGNDFTLHAPATPLMGRFTRLALQRCDGLHSDCRRDVRLAQDWGFSKQKPAIVLPGAGGIQLDTFFPPHEPVAAPVVINPRGMRAYVNNAAFFKAIPLVLSRQPRARFLCTTMQNEPQARRWVEQMGIEANVDLLPSQTRTQMADLFRTARVAVSPSNHDGTPNTLLEAMACGCLPVAGDLESIREWIVSGENGLLVDPNDPEALAGAISQALEQDVLRQRARAINAGLVAERAEYESVMHRAVEFYQSLI